MLRTEEVYIRVESDFKKLEQTINSIQAGYLVESYMTEDGMLEKGTIDEIKSNIWKDDNKDLKIIVEYPYYDREYLNEFSNYYCKKFDAPSNKTFRLIFYKKQLDEAQEKEEFIIMGHIILVPTSALNHIGRISFDPKFLIHDVDLMLTTGKLHLNGIKEKFPMFPHARQYGITACGHVSIWGVSKFVGSSWDRYSEKDFEQIVNTVSLSNPKTKISPPELTVSQIAGVLADFGYRPLFRPNTKDTDNDIFLEELYSYIDSEIPLVLLDGKYDHATIGIGYQRDKLFQFEFHNSIFKSIKTFDENKCKSLELYSNDNSNVVCKGNIKLYSDKVFYRNVILNDDNNFPYRSIGSYNNNKSDARLDLSLLNLVGFIVPLYPRINIDYSDVSAYSWWLIENKGLDLGFIENNQEIVFTRIFLTTGNKCREHIFKQTLCNSFAQSVHDVLKTVELPKLCWMIEYSSSQNQYNNQINGFSIINSTCSFNDSNAVLFTCGNKKIEYFDNDKRVNTVNDIKNYSEKSTLKRFDKNLNHIN